MPPPMTKARIAAAIGATPQVFAPLPFADTAIEPVISAKTLGFHHGKHHRGYFDALTKLVVDTQFAKATLEDIIMATHAAPDQRAIFNNAAQCWNHDFYWACLSPAPQTPSGALASAIIADFGSIEAMQAELARVASGQFGAGWGWLVSDDGRLKIIATSNADVPFTAGQIPLLTIDVWEHAYYLDWQNARADHVRAIIAGHLNWAMAAARFARI